MIGQKKETYSDLAVLDPMDWKAIQPILENHPITILRELADESPGIIISDDTTVDINSTGRRKSALAHFIVPLLDEIASANRCSIVKAAELALEDPWVKLRGTSTAAGVRSAYNNQSKKPAKLTLQMFYWFLFEQGYREAAMAFRYLSADDRTKFIRAMQTFSNRTCLES